MVNQYYGKGFSMVYPILKNMTQFYLYANCNAVEIPQLFPHLYNIGVFVRNEIPRANVPLPSGKYIDWRIWEGLNQANKDGFM